jgi:hypothetical protein
MIKFLRKIRQNLLSNGKTRMYLKYAKQLTEEAEFNERIHANLKK